MYYDRPYVAQTKKISKQPFSVITKWKELRSLLMDVCRFNLSYSQKDLEEKINKMCGLPLPDTVEDTDVDSDEMLREVNIEFAQWFMHQLRQNIFNWIRDLSKEIYIANSIYPTSVREVQEVRIHQDRAIALLYLIDNEFKASLLESPVPLLSDKKVEKISSALQAQISLIKGWRKSTAQNFSINQIQDNRNRILYQKPYYA